MRLAAFALLCLIPALHAQTAEPWKQFDFLLGKWTGVAGEKDTPLGAGQGQFSFLPELNRKIVVRRNNASYASDAQHDDLMIIYLDSPTAPPRAIYFDTEGHTIQYRITFPEPRHIVFESDPGQPGPAYKLTYWLDGTSLNGKFEVGGKTYMTWTSRKAG
jgi:hypothetical protein